MRTCFRCLFNGAVDPSTTWTFNVNEQIDSNDGTVTDGVLTVFDPTSIVLNSATNSFNTLICRANNQPPGNDQYTALLNLRGMGISYHIICVCVCVRVCVCVCVLVCVCVCVCVSVCLSGNRSCFHCNLYPHTVLVPPIITGPKTVNESDDLTLTCDHSASLPVDRFYWVMPNRSVLMNVASIVLTNISRSSSGNYTCNIQDDRNNTVSSTVTIVVQCKSV